MPHMHNQAEKNACILYNEIAENPLHLYRAYEHVQFDCKIDIELE
ncbi:hypothetical protein VII00023_08059 [Vibrio ichthyoenteri ATCC 700023]|uniref:Uncharacterized protein n=1 Tax=Vibrio ichthyoenteri ATCC 700023 TaxID=870968 RepID=F9RZX3_9VIBR|nr:hypothetical protein VII00023_08059 [Vibrio ichthyoenteri ATCC 700023]